MFSAKNELFTRPSGGFVIPRSLRFRASASAYLNRTFGTPTSNTTWTLSLWLKRGRLPGGSTRNDIFSAGTEEIVFYQGTEVLYLRAGSISTAVFRDTSAWYHLVIVSNGTTVKGYINNSEVVSYTGTMTSFNSAAAHTIGQYQNNLAADGFFDGYMAEINFVDGQALATTSFGATSTTTGVWSPKKYTGTYGNNGFHLDFNSYATQAALGTDTSGNSNTWTVNNCSVTAGVTYDSMIDVPTVTATGSNYAVINPLNGFSSTIVNANLTQNGNGAAWACSMSSMAFASTDHKYCEVTIVSGSGSAQGMQLGIIGIPAVLPSNNCFGTLASGYAWQSYGGNKQNNGSAVSYNGGATYATNDIIGIDYNNGTLTFYKNNTSQGSAYTGLTGTFCFASSVYGTDVQAWNFGQRPFTYTPPSGYSALNTYNLAAASILKGNLYMDATTYEGTGASLSVTNAGGFQPGFVWAKSRSAATDHALYDSVRGTTKQIESNTTTAETTEATGLTAFNSTGFTVGALAQMNTSAATYVGWQWKAGSTVTNTTGSRTTSVSASTISGCSVVTGSVRGVGVQDTFGHGLGITPQMILVKDTSGVYNWANFHVSVSTNTSRYLVFTTAAVGTYSTVWGAALPTSSVFGLTGDGAVGPNNNFVAYCFAPIAGFSAFGSYVGNSNVDGPFAYLGFRPRYLMIKNASSASFPWVITDTARNPTNTGTDENELRANSTQSEAQAAADYPSTIDILSNGFKIRENNTTCYTNELGSTFIYAAFAENPFNNSLAR